jgi:hypothetical protein
LPPTPDNCIYSFLEVQISYTILYLTDITEGFQGPCGHFSAKADDVPALAFEGDWALMLRELFEQFSSPKPAVSLFLPLHSGDPRWQAWPSFDFFYFCSLVDNAPEVVAGGDG